MSPALSRVRRVLTITIACLSVLGATALPASADSAGTLLARTTPLFGPCAGSYWTVQATGLVANPDGWHGSMSYVRVDVGGIFETIVRRQTGVSRYERVITCQASSNYRRVDSPTKYVHQFIYQNWACYEGGCQYLYTNYGSWLAGV